MTENKILLVTIDGGEGMYEEGLEAIQSLKDGEPVEQPAKITLPNEEMLGEIFNERTYKLLRIIREESPTSIRETARLVDRDKKNVHAELTKLEALGVIRLEDDGHAKRPVFPYDNLFITPFRDDSAHSSAVA
ncbi:winged helix-turn-helix transcriptional regulator [Natronorubrum sp. FCH18a]|uniref:HVO_A0114 family putative DNA-binding protein n=1 Tax=Natronorubrum sp. FCH18a TaxID=3447018 RepID=UPI003F50F3FA